MQQIVPNNAPRVFVTSKPANRRDRRQAEREYEYNNNDLQVIEANFLGIILSDNEFTYLEVYHDMLRAYEVTCNYINEVRKPGIAVVNKMYFRDNYYPVESECESYGIMDWIRSRLMVPDFHHFTKRLKNA